MIRIGVLGSGQLGRMLALAAYPLERQVICYDAQSSCASDVCPVVTGALDDYDALLRFAKTVDVITYETENIPFETVEFLNQHTTVHPPIEAILITQDRLKEKQLLQTLDIPCAPFMALDNRQNAQTKLADFGFPLIVKSRTMGYDGKGQYRLEQESDFARIAPEFPLQHAVAEKIIPFDTEVSLISVRHANGDMVFYPLVENYHEQGILRYSKAPFISDTLQKKAEDYATKLLNYFHYVGVFTIEFFVVNDTLLVNELAPRVHNSGHWTIEGAACSQFENHVRAITQLPLGNTQANSPSWMINFIGTLANIETCLAIPGAHYHSYNKAPRENRKVGHVTIVSQENVPLSLEDIRKKI